MKKLMYFFLFSIVAIIAACDDEGETLEKPSIFISDIARFEGNDGTNSFSLRVKMSDVSTEEVTFSYETRDGDAKAGDDYTSASGTGTIAAGTNEVNISIEVLTDTLWEEDEEFDTLHLRNRVVQESFSKVTMILLNFIMIIIPGI